MKKKLFFKFFVLVLVTGLLGVTSCQHDELGNETPDGEVSQQEFDALKNSVLAKITNSVNTTTTTLSEQLAADIATLQSSRDENVDLQKSIIQNALLIEYLNSALSTTSEGLTALRAGSSCSSDGLQTILASETYYEWMITLIPPSSFNGYGFKEYTGIDKINAAILYLKSCAVSQDDIADLYQDLADLQLSVNNHISLITSILGIVDGESTVLKDINDELTELNDIKANKFTLNEKLYDLKDVYDELIAITDALDVRLTQAEADIDDLQERVAYIEEVEIPKIWEGISILYDFISDVYDNLDHRVTGLTFKPDYDFGAGLSSLILVRGLSEWEAATIEGGFGWQKKGTGSVYKGITFLKYNVSPANAEIPVDDLVEGESIDLLYTTTTLITRSTTDPLLKILNDETYPITFENGVLSVPVLIHADAYPLVQTSFDANAKESIKVALRIKNEGIIAPDEPTRPTPPNDPPVVSVLRATDDDTDERWVVSSEYVTVWLGLFDGRIAEKDASKTDEIGAIFPTQIITADFLAKDCSETDYPLVTLWAGQGKPNQVNIPDSILDVYFDGFESKYHLPAGYNFLDHSLSYELVNLGNGANAFVENNNGLISIKSGKTQQAIGETLAVLVKAKVDNAVHAVGYVRVLIVGDSKELIQITPNLTLNPVTLNCGAPVEFTSLNTVRNFISTNILNKPAVNQKTNITSTSTFYQKYTIIEIDWENSVKPAGALESHLAFEYVTSGQAYIKGTISNEAPLGEYTVVTTLKSTEYIPDLQVTWKFSTRIPQLKPTFTFNQFLITPPAPSPNNTASYTGLLNNAFQRKANGEFIYDYLSGQNCDGFVVPNFVFYQVPEGYTISEDGRSVLGNGEIAAVIEEEDGLFYVRLIEGSAAYGLVGNLNILARAEGTINGGVHVTYPPFNLIFVSPLALALPTNASFTNNQFAFNFYQVNSSGTDIIRTWDNQPVPLKNNKETARLLIDYYGINYLFENSYQFGSITLNSPLKLDLADIKYASGGSNTFNNNLSDLGATVTVGQFYQSDTEPYFNITTPIRYRLAFNANGAALPNNLRISIPVTLQHRWGVTTQNLVIRVN